MNQNIYLRIISMLVAVIMIISMFPTISLAAGNEMGLTVSTATGSPGETVAVAISLDNNPGIASLKFDIAYDETYLTLSSVSFSDGFGAYVTAPEPYGSPQTISFLSPLSEVATNGLFATLVFSISESAPDGASSALTVTYDEDDVCDGEYNNIQLDVTNGAINIMTGMPGDIDGNRKVNNKDAILLFRYVAGWSVEVDYGALDVTGDGKANNKDAITLFRYVAGWPNITLYRGAQCNHTLEAIAAKEPSCTETGNIGYWHCTVCGKYFSDANATKVVELADTALPALGHTPVRDPAVPATTTSTGLTEGSHCAVCGTVLVAQEVIPKLTVTEHAITYDIANGDTYLEGLLHVGAITNNNPATFSEEDGLTLKNLEVAGYRFAGWYDGASSNAVQIKVISPGTNVDLELYAHWEKINYKVQFKSSLFLDENEITYTVDTGAVLPTPRLSNYVFTGWSDDDGMLYASKKIPAGTIGNITLNANWISERNKTWTKQTLDDPIIHISEETNSILFVYEIGEIQNVPLYTIKDFGYIAGDGITRSETATYSVTISETAMQAYSKAVANATTESSNWTLTEDWNQVTSINEEKCQEKGLTKEEAETIAKSSSDTWNVSSGSSGSVSTTHLETNSSGLHTEAKVNADLSLSHTSTTHKDNSFEINGNIGAKVPVKKIAEVEGEVGLGYEHQWGKTNEKGISFSAGIEAGSQFDKSNLVTDSATASSSWNSSSSFGGSSTNSASQSVSMAISEKINERYGFGQSYTNGGASSNSQGLTKTQSASDEYSASVTYSTETTNSVSSQWTTQSTKAGYHRWVVAGTAHVFAVVGYDMGSKSYFVYTYSVMDDETHEFEDYSYTTASYNDEQNGVISFEIPLEVGEYVAELTALSDGLKVNQDSGIITGYTGTDNYVVIPEYMNVGNGKVIRVNGISASAFNGNQDILGITLSDYTTEIPANAFNGCNSLTLLNGGSVTSIKEKAFYGCTGLEICGISNDVTYLGNSAFTGVGRILVNPSNASVAIAASKSGAKKVELYDNNISDEADALSGVTLEIDSETELFEFNGYNKTYNNLKIKSDAAETRINEATLNSTNGIPVQISSPKVAFDAVTVNAAGIAMVLSAQNTNVGLKGAITVQSENENALLCKNLSLYELNPQVEGKLHVIRKVLVCGNISNRNLMSYIEEESIDETTFNNMLSAYTLYFDANGGTCTESSRIVHNGTPIGELPTPTRQYYLFDGWYLSDGTMITKDTVFSTGTDLTVYAHWTLNSFIITFNKNCTDSTASVSATTMRGYCGQALEALPTAHRDYYDFDGWYTDASGGTRVTEETIYNSAQDITLYAHWTIHPLSAWVKASEVPSGAQVVNRKWRYTKTTTVESSDTSMSGYTQIGSYWVESGDGSFNYASFPDGFDTENWYYTNWNREPLNGYENATAKREVSTWREGWIYWHWMYDTSYANGTDQRAIYNRKATAPSNGFYYKYFGAFDSKTDFNYGGTGYTCNLGWQNYICYDRTSWNDCQGALRWFRFDYYRCAYTDYYKMFRYRKIEQDLESTTQVTPGTSGNVTISDVQEWVQYRAK